MVLVDSRERPNKREPDELVDLIRRLGLKAEKYRLPYGDFAFDGLDSRGPISIGIERKRLTDLSMSIDDNRLAAHQRVGCLESGLYQEAWLIVEGIWRPHDPKGVVMMGDNAGKWWEFRPASMPVLYSKLRRYLFSAERAGWMVIQTRDMLHTAWDVKELYHYYQKKRHTSQVQKQTLNIPTLTGTIPLVQRWAQEIDGVDLVYGQRAAAFFKTPIALATADEIEWYGGVEGIGMPTAKKIVAQIQGERP